MALLDGVYAYAVYLPVGRIFTFQNSIMMDNSRVGMGFSSLAGGLADTRHLLEWQSGSNLFGNWTAKAVKEEDIYGVGDQYCI